LRLLRGK